MTSDRDKPKRWRPRWSVRTLVILVTLACAYFACWGPTHDNAGTDVVSYALSVRLPHTAWSFDGATTLLPLFIRIDETESLPRGKAIEYRRYYFWFFGYVARLPYERHKVVTSPWPARSFLGAQTLELIPDPVPAQSKEAGSSESAP